MLKTADELPRHRERQISTWTRPQRCSSREPARRPRYAKTKRLMHVHAQDKCNVGCLQYRRKIGKQIRRKDLVSEMPFAGYTNFAECVADQLKKGKSKAAAQRICGALQSQTTGA